MTPVAYQQPLAKGRGLSFAALAILTGALVGAVVSQLGSPLLVGALIVGLVAAVVTLTRPDVGLIILAAMTFTRLSDVLISHHSLPSTAQPFITLLVISTAVYWFRARRRPVGWQALTMWLLLYGTVIFASLLGADNLGLAEAGIENYAKDALPAILAVLLVQSGDALRRMAWTLIIVGALMGTLSCFQYLTGTYSNSYLGFGQADYSSIAGEGDQGYRISGPFDNSNFYAQVMLMLLPLAFDRMLHARGPARRALAGYALAVIAVTVLVTFSRGAFIALIVMVLFQLVRTPPKPLALGLGLLLLALMIEVAPASYRNRIATVFEYAPVFGAQDFRNEASFRGRSSELTVAWQIFLDHPILGVGIGNYRANYLAYSSRLGLDSRSESRSAHSLYLEIAAELGIVGLATFLSIIGATFHSLITAQRRLRQRGLPELAALARALEISLVGYLASGFFLHMAFARPFWLMIGLSMAAGRVALFEIERRAQPAEAAAR